MLVCVLAVGLLALVVDRVFLDHPAGPDEAAAQQPEPSSRPPRPAPRAGGAAAPRQAATPPAPQPDTQSLAARLEAAAKTIDPDLSNSRDGFTMPEAWWAEMQPPPAVEPSQAQQPAPTKEYKLMAVMVSDRGEGRHAIIDGKCLLLGEELDGLKLVSVTQQSAVLAGVGDGVRIELKLQEQP